MFFKLMTHKTFSLKLLYHKEKGATAINMGSIESKVGWKKWNSTLKSIDIELLKEKTSYNLGVESIYKEVFSYGF